MNSQSFTVIKQATENVQKIAKGKFTLTHDSKLLPYLAWKASLMSPKSISDLDTMMRMSVLSFVPEFENKFY